LIQVNAVTASGGTRCRHVASIPASIRRQSVRSVESRKEGGYRDAFEVVCCDCGDRLYWDHQAGWQLRRRWRSTR